MRYTILSSPLFFRVSSLGLGSLLLNRETKIPPWLLWCGSRESVCMCRWESEAQRTGRVGDFFLLVDYFEVNVCYIHNIRQLNYLLGTVSWVLHLQQTIQVQDHAQFISVSSFFLSTSVLLFSFCRGNFLLVLPTHFLFSSLTHHTFVHSAFPLMIWALLKTIWGYEWMIIYCHSKFC